MEIESIDVYKRQALKPLASGTTVELGGQTVTLICDIPQGHKFALASIAEGAPVIKYGCAIGVAKETIEKGTWVHTHNLKTGLGDLLTYTYDRQETAIAPTE